MNLLSRQTIAGLLFSFTITILILFITFLAFPLNEWSDLWNQETFDIPYIMFISTFVICTGVLGGWYYGWMWRRRVHAIYQRLDELMKGHPLSLDHTEQVIEFIQLNQQLQKLEDKLTKQTELSQRLATERANEREESLQEVVVQERNRLARELHDSVSQHLFAASMMMSAINDSNPPENDGIRKQMSMVEHMIQQSQLEMRALLLHLRPVPLTGKSLQEGMQELLEELTQKVPMEIDWKVETFHLDKGIEDQLFRILQEAVSNTLRHAEAYSLHVMLIQRDEFVIMRVVDDGKGFNVEEEKTSSYGLHNMQERAMEVGGTLKVISLPNQGTRLEVKVPYVKGKGDDND
ncbi:sensor histidine kinase [Pontibacillus yanchengensis]|uniref:Sensor histidine kinase n=2 Tax=Pontibacillus yanchengensis TaxID=462910 RepID=A0ACC7VHH2_9BACI|nr:sensor histidine kinase [Pontibacillus yanchengensis]MYL35584.1 sensor histidine kinase [Pontibacillus yanchengensis]MYL53644.1 sensor histidine kinase [Pontibacillus yanchengensis]